MKTDYLTARRTLSSAPADQAQITTKNRFEVLTSQPDAGHAPSSNTPRVFHDTPPLPEVRKRPNPTTKSSAARTDQTDGRPGTILPRRPEILTASDSLNHHTPSPGGNSTPKVASLGETYSNVLKGIRDQKSHAVSDHDATPTIWLSLFRSLEAAVRRFLSLCASPYARLFENALDILIPTLTALLT